MPSDIGGSTFTFTGSSTCSGCGAGVVSASAGVSIT